MAGRLGKELVTIQKLKVIVVDNDKKLMMVDGSVPGAKNTLLVIKKTVKKVISDDAKHRSQQKKGKGKK
jgi:large subunit ribosomal protein L3